MAAQRTDCLMVIPHLRAGGAENIAIRIANGLARGGRKLVICAVDGEGELASQIDKGIQVVDLKTKRTRYAGFKVIRTIRRVAPRVVFSTLSRTNVLVCLLRSFLRNSRVVIREVNTPSIDNRLGEHAWFLPKLTAATYRNADLVICQSHAMRRDIEKTYGIAGERTRTIYNPLPVEQIRRKARRSKTPFVMSDAANVVFCGRLSRQKGVDILLYSLQRLKARGRAIHLHVLGRGDLCADLQRLAKELGLEGYISWHGYREDRYRYFAHSEVVVLPSRWEGLPNVVLEALACGASVVATECPGGTAEIIRDSSIGLLARNEDPEDLADKIELVLKGLYHPSPQSVNGLLGCFEEEKITGQYDQALFGNCRE